jgi:hypothetical protein
MSTKAALRAAKAALDAGKYADVITQSQEVLASDSQNYFAYVLNLVRVIVPDHLQTTIPGTSIRQAGET